MAPLIRHFDKDCRDLGDAYLLLAVFCAGVLVGAIEELVRLLLTGGLPT